MTDDYLRGHRIQNIDGLYYYCDNGQPTIGNERKCGYCGLRNTPEGHDGCLGALPSVMNACCGHGQYREAYLQFYNKNCVRGNLALYIIGELKRFL